MTNSIPLTGRAPATDRNRRERLGISVDDLAAMLNVSPQALTTYEQAKSEEDADPTLAMRLGDVLDRLERDADKS